MKLALPTANVRANKNGARVASRPAARNGASVRAIDQMVGTTKGKPRSRNQSDWRPIATFVVEFELRDGEGGALERRTRAHHHEATRDKAWPGFVRAELCDWIASQVQDQLDTERAQQVTALAERSTKQGMQRALAKVETPALDWQVSHVRLARAGRAERIATLYDHGRSTPALLAADSAFVIELDLERASVCNSEPSHVDGYVVRALNRDTRARIELGTVPLVDGDSAPGKTLNLNVTALPTAGSYRLECVPVTGGRILDASAVAVPLLQVV